VIQATIFGCAGTALTSEEAEFFARARPWGFILFGRNIVSPDQVRALIADLRAAVGRPDAPILIDQEGGRVARLRPPHWPAYPPARAYLHAAGGDLARAAELARLGARLMAHDLFALGIDVDCAPVIDVPAAGAHDVIGDRAYADTPEAVAKLGAAVCEGLLAGGVLPIVKHMPGHGRALADSHLDLPVVEASVEALQARDFAPFRALADAPMAMTAHVVYAAVDAVRPATTSPWVIGEVIRGSIGFTGLLVSDDISMRALSGDFACRTRQALGAGCDLVLHCNGDLAEMAAVAAGAHALAGDAEARAGAALGRRRAPQPIDAAGERARFDEAMAVAA
jgi:beta-N-acetylhexosaminidase